MDDLTEEGILLGIVEHADPKQANEIAALLYDARSKMVGLGYSRASMMAGLVMFVSDTVYATIAHEGESEITQTAALEAFVSLLSFATHTLIAENSVEEGKVH